MLTPKENFVEVLRGGAPDRFLKQFEFVKRPYSDPYNATNPSLWEPGPGSVTDYWGVTFIWPEGTPGPFPVHDETHRVVKDISDWKACVKRPPVEYSDDLWKAARADYDDCDRSCYLVGPTFYPGLFEQTCNLMGMEEAMMAFYTNPDEMHELIQFIAEWQMSYLKEIAVRLHPDCVFYSDDWGSSRSTFLSVDMLREFYLEPYKTLYQCFKDNGYQYIIHHCDCYAATYVPLMIEMGIDVWQGGTAANDIPELVKQFGGQLTFLTGIDDSLTDTPGWSREKVEEVVRNACRTCGRQYFIPCHTQGAERSIYPGVYEAINEAIEKMSREMF